VLLPSTRAFGRVPLTGEADKPRRKERALVAPEEDTNEQLFTDQLFTDQLFTDQLFTDQQPRCEIGKVLTAEGECRRLGEVQLDGSLLCTPHAELLRLESHSETILGVVFEMDQWLENTDGEADELRVERVEQQRKEVVEQLRFNRTQLSLLRDELLEDQDGTT
jgi:hypothetical protein